MKLFYYQPNGHGNLSAFVCAESAEAAAVCVNALVAEDQARLGRGRTDWDREKFVAEDFEEAAPGVVITNDNE